MRQGKLGIAIAFLLVWLPYVAGVGLQERFDYPGFLGPALVLLSLILAALAGAWLARHGRPDPFGLSSWRTAPLLVVGGIAAMIVVRAFVIYAAEMVAAAHSSPQLQGFAIMGALAGALALGAVPSLAEDIITRGFPLFAIRSRLSGGMLITASALLYTCNHAWRFDWGLTEQLRLFCMGVAYAAAAWRFRSLWGAFGLHLGWNVAGAVLPADIDLTDLFRLIVAGAHLLLASLLVLARAGPNRDNSPP